MNNKEDRNLVIEFKKDNPELYKKIKLMSYDYTSSINTNAFIYGFIRGYNLKNK